MQGITSMPSHSAVILHEFLIALFFDLRKVIGEGSFGALNGTCVGDALVIRSPSGAFRIIINPPEPLPATSSAISF